MQETDNKARVGEEKEIDLLELASTLWKQKKKLIKWSLCGALVGLVVAFSIPKEYTTSVKLVPESTEGKSAGGGLGALASMAGLGSNFSSGSDAFYPQLYPDVLSSVPFTTGLFDVKVTTDEKDGNRTMTVREYLENETSAPWWSAILGFPRKLLGMVTGGGKETDSKHQLDNFRLTPEEDALVTSLNNRISATVDTKTSVVTITSKMQDPLVSAVLADTVVSRLRDFITDYRTSKARHDLDYAMKINKEAKESYYKAQQRYADYLDRNQGLAFHSAQTMRERLENEMTLAFNLYNQTAQQVQQAQVRVQESTPVYAVVTPATVPVRASSPRKVMILVGFTFLAFVACAGWILFISPLVDSRKKASAGEKNETPN